MAQNDANTTEESTPNKIDKELVAQTVGQLGDKRNPYDDDSPGMRYWNIAAYSRYEDVRRALLIDSENPDQLLYAWTNKQRTTWKVTNAGTSVEVSDIELETPDDVDDSHHYVEGWIQILLKELRYDTESGATSRSVSDEIRFVGSKTLQLRDVDGRKATFTIELTE
jgi:hypothetical protein